METSSEKEERKRRNAEKGLNRMSQIRSARPQSQGHHPTPSSSDVKKESFDARDRMAFFCDDDPPPQENPSHQISAAPVGLSEASTSSTLKQGGMHEISSANSQDVGSQAQLSNQSISARDVGEKDKPKPEASSIRKASANTESPQKTSRTQQNLFSSKLLNSCIIASERTRSLCALVIAFCVLLSHFNFTLLGHSIGTPDSSIASKPLYIILLTDFTIVLSRLFLDRKGVSVEAEEEKSAASQDNKENWDATVVLLERGLVAYRTVRALFTDFSIYAVVVICGTSLQ